MTEEIALPSQTPGRWIGKRYNENSSNELQASCPLGAQPEGKKNDREKHHIQTAEQIPCFHTHQIIVIGVAFIIPNNAVANSMMDEISQFIEENCEAQILDEEREIR